MSRFAMLRACAVGLAVATATAASPALADPITIGATLGISTFAASVVSFVITTAISPGAIFQGAFESGIISGAPPRLDAITPIGRCDRSFGPFMVAISTGNCMGDLVGDRTYMLIDKRLTIRRNDLVNISIRSGPMAGVNITKRFVEAYAGTISVAQEAPRLRLDFDADEIEWAYRVRALSHSLVGILWLMLVATFRPRSLNDRLAINAHR